MHRAGSRTVKLLCDPFGLDAGQDVELEAETLGTLKERLTRVGCSLKPHASDVAHFGKLRSDDAESSATLATHLGAERTPLLPSDAS